MSLVPGKMLGSYEVLAKLGEGGMGEVYRARDSRLARDVAIKVLPPAVADDPERGGRFQREAQLLAALNHPNIGAIHGFEREGSLQFLVLELIDGHTLADRLAREGRLHVDESLVIARQIADALEAAHDKGIIHRDLKPGNIMLTPEGRVKVLDFGLAKALEAAPSGDLAASPTLTMAATKAGVILGTAAYMAPEQAKGRLADKRCDVWSFGCVLFEMLSGRRAFEGEDLTDTIAAVVRGEPNWSALPPDVPEHVRLLIRRCLDKDRHTRISDMGTVRFLMNEPAMSSISSVVAPASQPVSGTGALPVASNPSRLAAAAAGLAAGIVVTGAAAWMLLRPAPAPPASPVRFAITSTADRPIRIQNTSDDLAISRDGTRIAYRVGTAGDSMLVVRDLAELEPVVMEGTQAAQNPFFSPDGKWLGFFNREQILKVPVSGGTPTLLCRFPGIPRGASWSENDTIVFGTSDVTLGLLSVPAAGGEPTPITTIEPGQADHVYPAFLPGGQAVLFSITRPGNLESTTTVLNLRTHATTTIGPGFHAQYMDPGYIVYGTDAAGALRAVRFDAETLEAHGEPLSITERVLGANGNQKFNVSRNGSLFYAPDNGASTVEFRSLTWVDRAGREEAIAAPPHSYAVPRVSPDGTRIAVDARDSGNDIWIWELARQTVSRLTNDPTNDLHPIWTPDSRRIIFASSRNGNPNLYWQSADGSGQAERLTNSPLPQFPTSISADQKRIVLFELSAGGDILELSTEGARKSAPLIRTPAVEANAEISPDGRWVAYQSNDSGIIEVYVRPFPNVEGSRSTISSGGGSRPVWSAKGSELFYLDGKGLLTSVPVQTGGSSLVAGVARTVLTTAYYPGFSITGAELRGYDVAPDGQRFLMLKENRSPNTSPQTLAVVLNWRETLEK